MSKALAVPAQMFDSADFFRTAYWSDLCAEAEANIRRAAKEYQPDDEESYYVKLIAVGMVAYVYDTIWWNILRSQLEALLHLNRRSGLLPAAEMKPIMMKRLLLTPMNMVTIRSISGFNI